MIKEKDVLKSIACCCYGDFIFILQPKCASTTMYHILIEVLKWRRCKFIEGKQYFAIVRHPVDRWVSAVVHTTTITDPDVFKDPRHLESLIEDTPYSMVMYHQSYFLRGLSPLNLFKIEDLTKMWRWLVTRGFNQTPRKGAHLNKSEDTPLKLEIHENIKVVMASNPGFADKLLDIYSKDLKYYRSAS